MIQPPNRFLPRKLWDKTWSEIDDVSALEVGNWVFDTDQCAHYAGKVTALPTSDMPMFEIEWQKSPDNVFKDWLSKYNMGKLIWADPCLNEEI